jgi:hypothetical protein
MKENFHKVEKKTRMNNVLLRLVPKIGMRSGISTF